jgi:hypothetical protein
MKKMPEWFEGENEVARHYVLRGKGKVKKGELERQDTTFQEERRMVRKGRGSIWTLLFKGNRGMVRKEREEYRDTIC